MRILRVLQSQSLDCGCFVGVYETYDGRTIVIVEEAGRGCRKSDHQPGQAIAAVWLGHAAAADGGAAHLA